MSFSMVCRGFALSALSFVIFTSMVSGGAEAAVYRPGQIVRTQLGGNVRVVRQFTPQDRHHVAQAACFVNKLFGRNLPLAPFNAIYVATFEKPIVGLTVSPIFGGKTIFIADHVMNADEKVLLSMESLGVTMAHESDHYLFNTLDPAVEYRIDTPISDALARALRDREQGTCTLQSGVTWDWKNRLQRVACECGFDLRKR